MNRGMNVRLNSFKINPSDNMKSICRGIALIAGLFILGQIHAQQDTLLPYMDYDLPKPYEIGKITVTGTFNSDANAIIGVTGLKSGSKVTIPGPEIQKAIRALWNLKLFTQVDIIRENVTENIIDLEIHLQERPRLAPYNYTGIKKNYNNKIK